MKPCGYRNPGLLALLTLGAIGCGSNNSTGPTVAAAIKVISGGSQTDTIQSQLAAALLVEVHGTNGQVVPNAAITFTALGPTTSDSAVVLVSAPSSGSFTSSHTATTDASGQASVVVQLGTKVGVAHLAISAASLNLADTVSFTVTAGEFATNLAFGSADTSIYQGGHVTLVTGLDRFGNPSSGPISVGSTSGPITLSGATVTGTAYGNGSISFTVNNAVHTSKITVVPQARLAAGGASGLVIFNTDGSAYRTFGTTQTSDLKYSPTGGSLALDHWPFNQESLAYTTDTVSGTTLAQLDPALTATSLGELFPQFSRDGLWIYFGYYDASYKKRLWRVHPDGTGSAQIPASDSANYDDINPSPSPDGTQLVYVVDHGGGSTFLNTVTIATGAVNAINTPGHSPTWAPTGNVIAYLKPGCDCEYGPLYTMNADGTNAHQVSATTYSFTIDWSADAQWIVAAEYPSGRIDIINATSGLTLPLDFTSGLLAPTWHP